MNTQARELICSPGRNRRFTLTKINLGPGIVSGAKRDKGGLFSLFFGTSKKAPMIEEFPLCVECELDKVVANGSNESFFGDIVGIHADEAILKNGKVTWDAFNPLLWSHTNAEYRSVGQVVGNAWEIGKTYEPT
jgi:flavin reductase (DIM6/NTAB) family NADH-FMN oxidoreductase RutF